MRAKIWVAGLVLGIIITGLVVCAQNLGNLNEKDIGRANGDMVINNETAWVNDTKTMDGNLTITEGGKLTLRNVTLIFNCTIDGRYGIEVRGGGALYIYDNDNDNSTTGDASVIKNLNASKRYRFLVRKNATFVIKNSEVRNVGTYNYPGIYIEADNVSIENNLLSDNYKSSIYLSCSQHSRIANNTITDGGDYVIYLKSSNYTCLESNKISGYCEAAIWLEYGSSFNTIANNYLTGGNHEITLSESNNNFITNTTATTCSGHGLYLTSFSNNNTIYNCNFSANSTYGIEISWGANNTTVLNTITNNCNKGIYLDNFGGTSATGYSYLINCTALNNEQFDVCADRGAKGYLLNVTATKIIRSHDSKICKQWYLNVKVKNATGDAIPNAKVRVRDNVNGTYDEIYTTGSDGFVRDIVCTEYDGNIYYTPHNVTAFNETSSNSTDVVMSSTKTIELQLPAIDTPPIPPMDLKVTLSKEDLVLTWTASPSLDLHHYLIYRNTTAGEYDFNFTLPVYNSSTNPGHELDTTWTDVGAGRSWHKMSYIVRAVDNTGQEEQNMFIASNSDWGVATTQSYTNQTIPLNGSLNIFNGGKLLFYNITLIVNCTSNGQYHIEVQSGGEMYICDYDNNATTPNDGSNITAADLNYHYTFWVRNESKFEMHNSELHGCGYDWGAVGELAGLFIETDNVVIDNCLMSHNCIGVLLNSSSNNLISNCTISDNDYGDSIYLHDSSNNTIINNVLPRSSLSLELSNDNTIENNTINEYSARIELDRSNNNTIKDNELSNLTGMGYAIRLDDSSNNTIINNNITPNCYDITCVGIYWGSNYTRVIGNNLTFGRSGIRVNGGNFAIITDNNASSNNNVGIYILDSTDNYISNNTANSNQNYGIRLLRSDNNSLVSNEAENSSVNDGIELNDGSDNNSIINNSLSLNNRYGIHLAQSSNNQITDCTIYNNTYDGICLEDSENNLVINNSVAPNNRYGIYLKSASENNIVNNTAWNNTAGVYVESSQNNTIANCALYNNSYGIELASSSDNNIITNCTVYNNSRGIVVSSSSDNQISNCAIYNNYYGIHLYCIYLPPRSNNNQIRNCTIYNNSAYGIYLYSGNNNSISNCQIHNNQAGVVLRGPSSNNNIIGCQIYNNTCDGVNLSSSSNTQIINSTITNSSNYDFYLDQNSQLTSLNTTFNRTKVYFADVNSTLNVSWYLHINVLWNNSVPAEFANVRIQDNINGTFDENYTTDEDGRVKYIIVQEYTQNQTIKINFTPHNITASQGAFNTSKDVTVDKTMEINITLLHNAPKISEPSISPSLFYSITEEQLVEFKLNISHPDNLTLTYHWYFDNVEVKNNSLENTSIEQKLNWSYFFDYTSVPPGESREYKIKIIVTDSNATVSRTWILIVEDVNAPPQILLYQPEIEKMTITLETALVFRIIAEEVDGCDLGYWWRVENDTAEKNETTDNTTVDVVIELPAFNATGNYSFIVRFYEVYNWSSWTEHRWDLEVVNLTTWQEEIEDLLSELESLNSTMNNLTNTIGSLDEAYRCLEEMGYTNLTDAIASIKAELDNLTALYRNLSTQVQNLTTQLEQANQTMEDALKAKEQAEKRAEREKELRLLAEYKLAASVVGAALGGAFAGAFVFSLLLKRKKK